VLPSWKHGHTAPWRMRRDRSGVRVLRFQAIGASVAGVEENAQDAAILVRDDHVWEVVGVEIGDGNSVRSAARAERDVGNEGTVAFAGEHASYNYNFKSNLDVALGTEADGAVSRASRPAMLAWAAYAFLAPGGRAFDPKKTLASQLGQHFGSRTALDYVEHMAKKAAGTPGLDLLIKDPHLDHTEWVRSAKTRAAETLFLERLWKRARELLPH